MASTRHISLTLTKLYEFCSWQGSPFDGSGDGTWKKSSPKSLEKVEIYFEKNNSMLSSRKWILFKLRTETFPIRIPAKRFLHGFFKAWKIDAFMCRFRHARPVTQLNIGEREDPSDFAKFALRRIICRVRGSSHHNFNAKKNYLKIYLDLA